MSLKEQLQILTERADRANVLADKLKQLEIASNVVYRVEPRWPNPMTNERILPDHIFKQVVIAGIRTLIEEATAELVSIVGQDSDNEQATGGGG